MLLRRLEHVLDTDDVLTWSLFPALTSAPGAADAFAATAVSLDLEFEDGTLLSATGATDQAHYGITPEDQYDSRALVVDQWNLREVQLGHVAGRRAVALYLVTFGSPLLGAGHCANGWVCDIDLSRRSQASVSSPVDLVDTRRGSHSSPEASRGNTVPAVAVPHGFNLATPVTDAGSWSWAYRWASPEPGAHPRVQAYSVSHIPSPWIGDRGVLQFMPVTDTHHGPTDRNGRSRPLSHDLEVARPHLHSLTFEDGSTSELTATDHVVLMRFSLPPENGGLLIDQVDDNGDLWRVMDDPRAQVVGWTDFAAPHLDSHSPRTYFALRADQPVTSWRGRACPERPHTSALLGLTPDASGRVVIRVATSFIGIDQAISSLEREAPSSASFDDLADLCRTLWEQELSRVQVDTHDPEVAATFASCQYRMGLYPSHASEDAGTPDHPRWVHADTTAPPPRPHGQTHTGCTVREGRSFVNNGFWDTYRTLWPALGLLAPQEAATMLDGFVQHFREGGWMERWSAPGPVDSMVGTSSDIISADLMASGVALVDPWSTYDAALRNATTVSADPRVGRAQADSAPFTGWVDTSRAEGLSWTLEGALNDYGIAQMSGSMAARVGPDHPRRAELLANQRWFTSRAMAWTSLLDRSSGFFVGRLPDGRPRTTGEDLDPRVWGGDYTETNAWGMAFSVPQDGNGLADLLGASAGDPSAGPDILEHRLDRFFSTPETADPACTGTYDGIIHEMTEARDIRMGMFGLSNQPAHHIPFMYAFTSAPHKGHALVRESLRRLFLGGSIGQGFPGDEDNGEMSAWYVLATLGLYPLLPGSGELLLVPPAVRAWSLPLPGGRATTMTCHGWDVDAVHIQGVRLDGREWTRQAVPIELLRSGVHLEMDLGPEPSTWGREPRARPAAMTPPGGSPHPERDLTSPREAEDRARASVEGAALVFDDSSREGILLHEGDWVEWSFPGRPAIGFYTVTLGRPCPEASWVLEARVSEEEWSELERCEGITYRWPQQTRAFEVTDPAPASALRLRVLGPELLDLRQVELFGH
ncbi:MAG: GH92 family glycosyl hydrolase [Propionibacterium sp.]|nr:GH92 family glycosyl hydrolase [Propionibacterium sp.]